MVTTADRTFVDTNILVYATTIDSPWHEAATHALSRPAQTQTDLVISPQIINEYLAVTTRPGTIVGLTRGEVLGNVRLFLRELTLVAEDGAVLSLLADLVEEFAVAGKQIHDANIVATMQAHGIRRLLTHNTADFARFAGLITVVPLVATT